MNDLLNKLKNKGTWGPLATAGALLLAWYTGVDLSQENVDAAAGGVASILSHANDAMGAAGAALGALGVWKVFKK